jgi:lambda repressor-like predicted transcriptional regulator
MTRTRTGTGHQRALNERLRRAVFDARMTPEQLAHKIQVDPKTVQRWIAQGRIPYPVHQHAVAVAVGVPEQELWPNTFEQSRYLGTAPEGWRVVEMTEETGVPCTGLELVPSPASAKSVTAVRELPETERESQTNTVAAARMRELMSWVPAPERRSALADYRPGSALANALDRTGREGMER